MGHQVVRDREIHAFIRKLRVPRPPNIVEQVAFGSRLRPAPKIGQGTLWDRVPVHEFLERATAAGQLPRRRHLEDIDPWSVSDRYRKLAFLEVSNGDTAAQELIQNATSWPRDRHAVSDDVRELWFAKRALIRGEFAGLMEGDWSREVRTMRERVVDVVSGFLVPNVNVENPHYVADQLWLIADGDGLRRVILEVRREGSELATQVARRGQMEALGYDVVAVSRAWALADPLRSLCAFADMMFGTTLAQRMRCPPESLDSYVCGICGEAFARREPLDIVRYAEEDVVTPRPLREARGFAHFDCANAETMLDAAQ